MSRIYQYSFFYSASIEKGSNSQGIYNYRCYQGNPKTKQFEEALKLLIEHVGENFRVDTSKVRIDSFNLLGVSHES